MWLFGADRHWLLEDWAQQACTQMFWCMHEASNPLGKCMPTQPAWLRSTPLHPLACVPVCSPLDSRENIYKGKISVVAFVDECDKVGAKTSTNQPARKDCSGPGSPGKHVAFDVVVNL
jgi:hypothetical protein